MNDIIKEEIENMIYEIRGKQVMLDCMNIQMVQKLLIKL